jgi:hypothetical protein
VRKDKRRSEQDHEKDEIDRLLHVSLLPLNNEELLTLNAFLLHQIRAEFKHCFWECRNAASQRSGSAAHTPAHLKPTGSSAVDGQAARPAGERAVERCGAVSARARQPGRAERALTPDEWDGIVANLGCRPQLSACRGQGPSALNLGWLSAPALSAT